MKNRLGIALGLAALIVAALGSTSVGQAAEGTLKATAGKVAGASPLASQAVPRRGPRGLRGRRGPAGPTRSRRPSRACRPSRSSRCDGRSLAASRPSRPAGASRARPVPAGSAAPYAVITRSPVGRDRPSVHPGNGMGGHSPVDGRVLRYPAGRRQSGQHRDPGDGRVGELARVRPPGLLVEGRLRRLAQRASTT